MAGCFYQFHLVHIKHSRKKSKSLEALPASLDDMTLLQGHKLPSKLGRLFRSKSEQGLKTETAKSSPSNSPRTDSRPRARRLLRVVRDDQNVGEEWENPHVVRRYSKAYWETQMSEAQALQHSTSMPYTVNTDHTILKKTQSQSTDSDTEGGNVSPSISHKHACFKEQVQVIEFVDKEKITKHVHYMHETALLEAEEEMEKTGDQSSESTTTTAVITGNQSRNEIRKEAHQEFTRARNSLDQCEDSEDSDNKLTDTEPAITCSISDPGVVGDISGSDTDEPKKKHQKKKLHLHMNMPALFRGSSSGDNRDSDSDVGGDSQVKRVNKKLLSTHLQTEVDNPEQ